MNATDKKADEFANGMMGLGTYSEDWNYQDKYMYNTIKRTYLAGHAAALSVLQEIADIVLKYHKENGNSPAANHCRNIALEALSKSNSTTESDAMKALIELVEVEKLNNFSQDEMTRRTPEYLTYIVRKKLAWEKAFELTQSVRNEN